MPVKGDDAARLANMGLLTPNTSPGPAPATSPAAPLADPPSEVPASPSSSSSSGAHGARAPDPFILAQLPTQPGSPASPPAYTGASFSIDQPVKRLWGIALRINKSADPPTTSAGTMPPSTWPRALGFEPWPKAQAQGVFLTELIAGAMLIAGLLTRVASLALMCVMFGAVWLDQCTPAIQSGSTLLGIFPAHEAFDVRAWMPLLWQLSIIASCLSLSVSGAGRLSLDAIRQARTAILRQPQPATQSTSQPSQRPRPM